MTSLVSNTTVTVTSLILPFGLPLGRDIYISGAETEDIPQFARVLALEHIR
jgi:hypothetical protein